MHLKYGLILFLLLVSPIDLPSVNDCLNLESELIDENSSDPLTAFKEIPNNNDFKANIFQHIPKDNTTLKLVQISDANNDILTLVVWLEDAQLLSLWHHPSQGWSNEGEPEPVVGSNEIVSFTLKTNLKRCCYVELMNLQNSKKNIQFDVNDQLWFEADKDEDFVEDYSFGQSSELVTGQTSVLSSSINSISIIDIKIQKDGKILVIGDFNNFFGIGTFIIRLNSDGSVDSSFRPKVNAPIYAIAIQADNKILIGGNFSIVNGVACAQLARLDVNGGLDQSFNFQNNITSYYDRAVTSIALSKVPNFPTIELITIVGIRALPIRSLGLILVPVPAYGIMRLSQNGSFDSSFLISRIGETSTYCSIKISPLDSKIILSGTFRSVNDNQIAQNIVRFNYDGTLDNSFVIKNLVGGVSFTTVTAPNGVASRLEDDVRISFQSNGDLIFGQSKYDNTSNVYFSKLGRYKANNTIDSTFQFNFDGRLTGLNIDSEDSSIVTGAFSGVNNFYRPQFAKLLKSGVVDSLDILPIGACSFPNELLDKSYLIVDNGYFYRITQQQTPPQPPAVALGGFNVSYDNGNYLLQWSTNTPGAVVAITRDNLSIGYNLNNQPSYVDSNANPAVSHTYTITATYRASNGFNITAVSDLPQTSSSLSFTIGPQNPPINSALITNILSSVSSTNPRTYSISWTGSFNPSPFEFVVQRNGSILGTTPTSNYTDALVDSTIDNIYTVYAQDVYGNKGPSRSITILKQAPSITLSNLVITYQKKLNGNPYAYLLSWVNNNPQMTRNYTISRNGIVIATVTPGSKTSFTDSSVNPAQVQTYSVLSFDNQGVSSTAVSSTTQIQDVEIDHCVISNTNAAISEATSNNTNQYAYKLTWSSSPNSDLVGYQIMRNGVFLKKVTLAEFTDPSIDPSSSYTYSIRAYDRFDNLGPATSFIAAQSLITNLQAKFVDANTFYKNDYYHELTWESINPSLSYGYLIYRDGIQIADLKANARSYEDHDMNPAVVHKYSVLAYSSNLTQYLPSHIEVASQDIALNHSSISNINCELNELKVKGLSRYDYKLNWTSAPNVDVVGYQISRNEEVVHHVSPTNCLDENINPGIDQVYTIAAQDRFGNVGPSSSFTAPAQTLVTSLQAQFVEQIIGEDVDYFYDLSWDETNPSNTAGFLIFRDDVQIDDVNGSQRTYEDHSINPIYAFKYSVLAYDSSRTLHAKANVNVPVEDVYINHAHVVNLQSHLIDQVVGANHSYFYRVSWQMSSNIDVVGYRIYKDDQLIAEIPEEEIVIDSLQKTAGLIENDAPLVHQKSDGSFVFEDKLANSPQPHKYKVLAYDRFGNRGPASQLITPQLALVTHFEAKLTENKYMNLIESYYKLTWQAASSAAMAHFKIFKNGELLVTLDGKATSYEDRKIDPRQNNSYSIQCVDNEGNESSITY
jgi:uncharacterized delta-60 repeat protein